MALCEIKWVDDYTSSLKQTHNQNWGRDFSRVFLILPFHKINQDKKASVYLQNHLEFEANSMALTAVFQGREEDPEFM